MTDDLISRQQAIMAIEQHRIAVLEGHKWDEGIEYGYAAAHRHIVDIVEQLPSAQPEIIRCKDCVYQTESWIGIKYCEAHGDHIGKDYDYCSNARRKENGH